MRLLKQKGIQLHRVRGHLNAEEETKSKLFAKYERRKKRQSERHVLRREMATHAIPRLFVSRRTDKNPNGFNWAICRKDDSFLSRGELEIWRHFSRKTHFAKDRRYRLDHEDFIYTEKFDEIAVATISPELRAEIELTPPVVLGPKNAFEEDEVDALVGVVSNVPCSTLVGVCLNCCGVAGPIAFLDVCGVSSGRPSPWRPAMPRPPGVKLSHLLFCVRQCIPEFCVGCNLVVSCLTSVFLSDVTILGCSVMSTSLLAMSSARFVCCGKKSLLGCAMLRSSA